MVLASPRASDPRDHVRGADVFYHLCSEVTDHFFWNFLKQSHAPAVIPCVRGLDGEGVYGRRCEECLGSWSPHLNEVLPEKPISTDRFFWNFLKWSHAPALIPCARGLDGEGVYGRRCEECLGSWSPRLDEVQPEKPFSTVPFLTLENRQ